MNGAHASQIVQDEHRISGFRCSSSAGASCRSMCFLQLLRTLFAANLNRLAADRDLDRVFIQFVIASCTSFVCHDFVLHEIPGDPGHKSSRPYKRKESLSESLAILWKERERWVLHLRGFRKGGSHGGCNTRSVCVDGRLTTQSRLPKFRRRASVSFFESGAEMTMTGKPKL